MNVTRFADAPEYQSPGHYDMRMVRLQGREAGPSDTVWMGASRIEPGGGTSLDQSPMEKMYIVIEGEVVISNGTEEVTLACWDSCRIAPGEGRMLRNDSDRSALIVLTMALAPS